MAEPSSSDPIPEQAQVAEPPNLGAFSLENILGQDHELLEHPGIKEPPAEGLDQEAPEISVAEGFCVECEGDCTLE